MNVTTKHKSYTIHKILHENEGLGVICGLARDAEYGECFIKIIDYGKFESKDVQFKCLELAKTEAAALAKVAESTRNVPQLYEAFHDVKERKYVIVMQKMPGITLTEWMKRHPATNMDAKSFYARRKIICQICQVMSDIYKKHPSLTHRDLKPDNILIRLEDHRWVVSVIDFGCAGLRNVRNVGTAGYCAPEQSQVYQKKLSVHYGPQTDIFAIGQIYYELLLGRAPLLGIDYVKARQDNVWEKYPSLPQPLLAMPKGKEIDLLLQRMTLLDPDERQYTTYRDIISILK